MKVAPSFIAPSNAPVIIPSVSFNHGVCKLTTSLCRNSVSRSTISTSIAVACSRVTNGSYAKTAMSKGRSRSRTRRPIMPSEISPTLLPYAPAHSRIGIRFPANFVPTTWCHVPFKLNNTVANVNSATGTAFIA